LTLPRSSENFVRIFDDKYRLFGIINPIDLLVLLLVAAVAVAGLQLLRDLRAESGDRQAFEYTIIARNVRDWSDDLVKPGETVRSAAGEIGKIVSVETSPTQVEFPTETGTVVRSSELEKDVYIRVQAEGDPDGGAYVVGGTRIQNNARADIRTERFDADYIVFFYVTPEPPTSEP
jgi:hypothetical protein